MSSVTKPARGILACPYTDTQPDGMRFYEFLKDKAVSTVDFEIEFISHIELLYLLSYDLYSLFIFLSLIKFPDFIFCELLSLINLSVLAWRADSQYVIWSMVDFTLSAQGRKFN